MSKPLSAVDCISPSFEWTKRQLFVPFRFRRWVRLAWVCMVLDDFAGGGGYPGNFSLPELPERGNTPQSTLRLLDWSQFQPFLPLLIAGALLVFALVILWLYMASVYRFVLFDSVLYDRCELKGAWGRWERAGRSYFGWVVSLFSGVIAVSLLLGGGAALLGWRLGVFEDPSDHLAVLILGGSAWICLMFAFFVATALAAVFAKDFCVPLMAIEDLRVLDAWRRLLPMVAAEKMAYAGFVLMKIVLAVGSTIIFTIITVLALIALAVPLAIAGVVSFLGAKAAGLTWDFPMISVVVVLGSVGLSGILYLLALISTPPMVFFQAYVIHFFGSRYPALGVIAFPPPPAPEPTSPLVSPSAVEPRHEPGPVG